VTYRAPDPERSRSAAQEREVAGWLQAMEEARRLPARQSRPLLTWVVMAVGPGVGTLAALAIALALGVRDRSILLPAGAATGFVVAAAVLVRRAMARKDGLRP
jgi:hypothetical protein